MEKENVLIQFLTAGISGGIIVLLIYLSKKAGSIKIGKKAGIILLSILLLIILVFVSLSVLK